MNYVRTGMLLAGLTALFMAVGYMIGGPEGMLIAFISRRRNESVQLLEVRQACTVDARGARGRRPHGARVCRARARAATRAGLPMPRVYLMDNPQPNAFATGRNPNHAAVAATTGLLEMLDPRELAGVIAHELGHIKNRDTLTMTVTATIAGAISMLAQFGMMFGGGRRDGESRGGGLSALLAVILAPIAAMLVQMAISRTREYAADRSSAQTVGRSARARLGARQDRYGSPSDRERAG